jgi:broad specificity phosphatase PhoE
MLVTSRFLRARQTAIPTQRLFRHIPYALWDVQEFTYLSSLHHLHLTQEERRPFVNDYWRNLDPSAQDAETSETFRFFVQRARNFLQKLFLPPHNQYELGTIFSHEQFILAVLWLTEKLPGEMTSQTMHDYYSYFQTHRIPNGGIVQLRFHPREEKWTGELITAHLNQSEEYPWCTGSYSMTAAD